MINQLLGPVFNLVGTGAFRAWTLGDWFFGKYSNLVMFTLVAVLFLLGLVINLPQHGPGGVTDGEPAAPIGAERAR